MVYIPEAADLRTVNESFKYKENGIDATETSVILPGLDRVATKKDEVETKGNKVATKEDEVETKEAKVAIKEDEVETKESKVATKEVEAETNRKKSSMKEKLSEEELMILHMVSENAFITQRELHEKTGISLGTVKRILPRLQEKGVLIRDGGKHFGKWIITKE